MNAEERVRIILLRTGELPSYNEKAMIKIMTDEIIDAEKEAIKNMKSALAAKDALLTECARVIAPFAKAGNQFIGQSLFGGAVLIGDDALRAAAELAKKLEGMK